MYDDALVYIQERANGFCSAEVVLGEGDDAKVFNVYVEDSEPDDVWGPIVSRAVDEAYWDATGGPASYTDFEFGAQNNPSFYPDGPPVLLATWTNTTKEA